MLFNMRPDVNLIYELFSHKRTIWYLIMFLFSRRNSVIILGRDSSQANFASTDQFFARLSDRSLFTSKKQHLLLQLSVSGYMCL